MMNTIGDSVAANSSSKVLDALKSRYSCLSEPLPPGASRKRDNNDDRRRYLTSLSVYGKREVEDHDDNEPQFSLPNSFSKLLVDQNITDPQIIKEKITAALSNLSLREPNILVQFWAPVTVGKRCLLTTLDQPFGLGVVNEGLYLYRLESEQGMFVVDGEHREELGPPGRVYCQKLPEWSLDAHTIPSRQSVPDFAACYNIHGYIVLPVFEPDSGCCVGILELVTSSNYVDYMFEVREVSRALKEENLESPNVFENHSLYVGEDSRQRELDEIFLALKTICDIQNVSLAQTWALSEYTSVVAISGNLERSCSSFNRSCIRKVCMSTTGLPFCVRDLSMWGFHEDCKEKHLEKSCGVVGRSLSSCGTWFCRDVTELVEDEYPLVTSACVNGITSCLAIYLKSIESDVEYVIELVVPPDNTNEADLQSLLKTVKQQIKITSSVQLGNMSSLQVIGGLPFNWNLESLPEPRNQQLSFENERNGDHVTYMKSEDSFGEHMADNFENNPSNLTAAGTKQNVVPCLEVGSEGSAINRGKTTRKYENKSNKPIRKRKRNDMFLDSVEICKHYGKTKEERADNFSDCMDIYVDMRKRHESFGIPRQPDITITEKYIQNTAADLMIEATYRGNTVKFPFRLSDGWVKLVEMVTIKFLLALGSFKLKYVDKDGDMILVLGDPDLLETVIDFKQPDNDQTVIRFLVYPVAHQSPNA